MTYLIINKCSKDVLNFNNVSRLSPRSSQQFCNFLDRLNQPKSYENQGKFTRQLKFNPDVPNTMRNHQKNISLHSPWKTSKIHNGEFQPKYPTFIPKTTMYTTFRPYEVNRTIPEVLCATIHFQDIRILRFRVIFFSFVVLHSLNNSDLYIQMRR